MRAIFLAIFIATLPAFSALAQQVSPHKPDKRAPAGRLLPLKGAASGNSCAAYGAGFVKVEGSDTCVKIGGGISVDAGAISGGR